MVDAVPHAVAHRKVAHHRRREIGGRRVRRALAGGMAARQLSGEGQDVRGVQRGQ